MSKRFITGCFLACSALFAGAAYAQDNNDLGAKEVGIVKQRLRQAINRTNSQADNVGAKAGQIVKQSGQQIDQNQPGHIHPMLQNDGSDNPGKAAQEYADKDTEAIYNPTTFAECIEDREVDAGPYLGECAAHCPGGPPGVGGQRGGVILNQECTPCRFGIDPGCDRVNQWYVSELYFPVYEARVYPGRAMGSFDATGPYLSGADKRGDLKLQATQNRFRGRGVSAVEETIQKYFGQRPASIQEIAQKDVFRKDYAFTDRNPDGSMGDPQALHVLVYQTNTHRQATRNRTPQPIDFLGYFEDPKCFLHTLDNPAKKVIARGSYDDQAVPISMRAYETKQLPDGQEALKATALDSNGTVQNLVKGMDGQVNGRTMPQALQGLEPSQRMQKWSQEFQQGLSREGFQPRQQKKDWLWYGIERGPFYANMDNSFTTPLYASIAAGVNFYANVAAKPGVPGNGPDRALQFTMHTARDSRPNYTGKLPNVQDNIIFTDKIQVVYPPKLNQGGSEGGQREGSACFRPEALARNERINSQNEIDEMTSENHNGMRRDMGRAFPLRGIDQGLNYDNEVRLVFWDKRVNCYCTECGVPFGCTNMNGGDLKEDNFYGIKSLANAPPSLHTSGQ